MGAALSRADGQGASRDWGEEGGGRGQARAAGGDGGGRLQAEGRRLRRLLQGRHVGAGGGAAVVVVGVGELGGSTVSPDGRKLGKRVFHI